MFLQKHGLLKISNSNNNNNCYIKKILLLGQKYKYYSIFNKKT